MAGWLTVRTPGLGVGDHTASPNLNMKPLLVAVWLGYLGEGNALVGAPAQARERFT